MRLILMLLILGLLIAAWLSIPFSNGNAASRFYVIDGDTIILNGLTYRLWGIDAPEKHQSCQRHGHAYRCGMEARAYLRSLIRDPSQIRCENRPRSQGETRIVALCRAKGADLGQQMAAAGWAIDYSFFSHGYYAAIEAKARADQRGLWAGSFQTPRAWRQKTGRLIQWRNKGAEC
jgi:endonuclease YncB( thermonuclease family)